MFGSAFIGIVRHFFTMSSHAESVEGQNVVASSTIRRELELEAVADDLYSTKFDPEQFPGIVYHLEHPKSAALIFRSGNIVCTGAKSVEAVTDAIHHVVEKLQSLGLFVPDALNIRVQNIVSSADLDRRRNLNAIAIGLGLEVVEYEPDQFPGLIYRLDDPDVVALLFESGKLVITGTKDVTAAERAIESIDRELSELGLNE